MVVAAGIAALSGLGFLDGRLWIAELATSVRIQLLLGAVLVAILALVARSVTGAGVAALAVALNALVLVPLYTGDAADPSGSERLRIAHVNMQGNDVDDEELQDALVEREPDVLVLLEPAPGWEPPPGTGYRHLAPTAQPRVHLLVATEVSDVRVPQDEEMPPASLAFVVALGTRPVGVLAVHAYAPSTPDQRDVRDGQLDAVGDWAVLQRGPELVLGDLNAVPWSDAMENLEKRDDLRSSVDGFGLQATWPALLGPLGIPIDQLFHSPDLTVTDRETGPSFGSAHRSLWVTVAAARPS